MRSSILDGDFLVNMGGSFQQGPLFTRIFFTETDPGHIRCSLLGFRISRMQTALERLADVKTELSDEQSKA